MHVSSSALVCASVEMPTNCYFFQEWEPFYLRDTGLEIREALWLHSWHIRRGPDSDIHSSVAVSPRPGQDIHHLHKDHQPQPPNHDA